MPHVTPHEYLCELLHVAFREEFLQRYEEKLMVSDRYQLSSEEMLRTNCLNQEVFQAQKRYSGKVEKTGRDDRKGS